MKKFRFLGFLVFSLLLTVSFTACGSDDDDDNGSSSGAVSVDKNQLIGTWDFVDGKETVSGNVGGQTINQTIDMDRQQLLSIAQQYNIGIWDITLKFTESTVNGQPYALNGNVLMNYSGEGMSVNVTIASITNTDMILHEVIVMSDPSMTIDANMHYKKK